MATGSPDANLSYYIDFYKERGASGVGELQAGVYLDDPRMMNLFAHCEKCKVPVTVHLSAPGAHFGVLDDPGLPRLERVLEQFPHLQFLRHVTAFWGEISGDLDPEKRNGYPDGPVTPGGRLVTLMRRYPNLCGDLSAWSGCNALTRDPEFGYRFLTEFSDRLYFATDLSSPKTASTIAPRLVQYLDDGYAQSYLSREDYVAICRENALRLLERT